MLYKKDAEEENDAEEKRVVKRSACDEEKCVLKRKGCARGKNRGCKEDGTGQASVPSCICSPKHGRCSGGMSPFSHHNGRLPSEQHAGWRPHPRCGDEPDRGSRTNAQRGHHRRHLDNRGRTICLWAAPWPWQWPWPWPWWPGSGSGQRKRWKQQWKGER